MELTVSYEQELQFQAKRRKATVDLIKIISELWYEKSIELVLFRNQLDDNLFSKDPKTNLQEFLQKHGMPLPSYSTLKSNKKSFKYLVKCKIPNTNISLHLDSNKVKPAEQELALSALKRLNEEN